jgi:hypothetical protein
MSRLNPNGRGRRRAIQPGGYHSPDSGLAAKGYPLRIVGAHRGIVWNSWSVFLRNIAFG